MSSTLRVLYLPPGATTPRPLTVVVQRERDEHAIDHLEALVGGSFDLIRLSHGRDAWVNDEGALNGMPPSVYGIRGPIVITRHSGPNTTSVRPEDETAEALATISAELTQYGLDSGYLRREGGRVVVGEPHPPRVVEIADLDEFFGGRAST